MKKKIICIMIAYKKIRGVAGCLFYRPWRRCFVDKQQTSWPLFPCVCVCNLCLTYTEDGVHWGPASGGFFAVFLRHWSGWWHHGCAVAVKCQTKVSGKVLFRKVPLFFRALYVVVIHQHAHDFDVLDLPGQLLDFCNEYSHNLDRAKKKFFEAHNHVTIHHCNMT